MQRDAMTQLLAWKNSRTRKPLVLRGARQVGKTWLMKEFGNSCFENCVYINFEKETALRELFEADLDVLRILTALELQKHCEITAGKTLILFDEIQECPRALLALKYFCEEAAEYHVIAAGSLLGTAHHSGTGFPVGKVEFLNIYPMSFMEFICAAGEEKLRAVIEENDTLLLKVSAERLTALLKEYYYTGGMPEAVQCFVSSGCSDYAGVRRIQEAILTAYMADFSKHASGAVSERIKELWISAPCQLAKENNKFVYNAIKPSARAREYEEAINWLKDAGLLYKVSRITKPDIPLKAYEDRDIFKLYLHDVGLLSALSALSAKTIVEGNRIFTEFKGALTEQYVLQQIIGKAQAVHYWVSKSYAAEIDFVAQFDEYVVPIEVKAEQNLRAKSLSWYMQKYRPQKAVKTSLAGYEVNGALYNIPLYAVGNIEKILKTEI